MKSLTEYISESELNNKRTYGGYKLPNKENIMYTHMKQYLHIL